jgi:hypothetical protein
MVERMSCVQSGTGPVERKEKKRELVAIEPMTFFVGLYNPRTGDAECNKCLWAMLPGLLTGISARYRNCRLYCLAVAKGLGRLALLYPFTARHFGTARDVYKVLCRRTDIDLYLLSVEWDDSCRPLGRETQASKVGVEAGYA